MCEQCSKLVNVCNYFKQHQIESVCNFNFVFFLSFFLLICDKQNRCLERASTRLCYFVFFKHTRGLRLHAVNLIWRRKQMCKEEDEKIWIVESLLEANNILCEDCITGKLHFTVGILLLLNYLFVLFINEIVFFFHVIERLERLFIWIYLHRRVYISTKLN